jgi:hypothetical protein
MSSYLLIFLIQILILLISLLKVAKNAHQIITINLIINNGWTKENKWMLIYWRLTSSLPLSTNQLLKHTVQTYLICPH